MAELRFARPIGLSLAVTVVLPGVGWPGLTTHAEAQTPIRLHKGPPQGTGRPIANAFRRAIKKQIPKAKVTMEPGGGLSKRRSPQ